MDKKLFGGVYSKREYIRKEVFVMLGMFLLTYLMQMKWMGICFVLCAVFLAFPKVMWYRHQSFYEKKRFEEAVTYMEYVIYGFLRMPKILSSLEETVKLCQGKLEEVIRHAVDRIRYADVYEDIYQEALGLMEKEYGNHRMRELHRFLIQIEQQGGEYRESLEVLLENIRQWDEMVQELMVERKELSRKVSLSILLSFATAVTMVGLLPQDMGRISDSMLYQVSSVIFLLAGIGLYVLCQKTLVRSWLSNEKEADMRPVYEYCLKHKERKNRHYFFQEKKLKRYVEKEFSIWLRNVILNMYTENVVVAMEKGAEQCSYVLKHEVLKALENIQKKPDSMGGYESFFQDFHMPAVKNVFLMFYSLSEFGTQSAQGQMNALIQRNNKLSNQSERIINEDSLGIFGIYMLCPMVLAAGKMLLDMWVFVQQFLVFYSRGV